MLTPTIPTHFLTPNNPDNSNPDFNTVSNNPDSNNSNFNIDSKNIEK
jgi:hypothetical protein